MCRGERWPVWSAQGCCSSLTISGPSRGGHLPRLDLGAPKKAPCALRVTTNLPSCFFLGDPSAGETWLNVDSSSAALQRMPTLAAGGRTHADSHQAAAGARDRRADERPLFEVQLSYATRAAVRDVGDCFGKARTGSTDPSRSFTEIC